MKLHIQTPEKIWRWRLIQSRSGCALFFTEEWCCTMMWHQKLASCFALDRTLQGPGEMWQPWPALHALSSVSGSCCSRCLATSAPALRERGKGGGRKGCEGCCKQSAFTAVASTAIPISDIISLSLVFRVMYSFDIRRYRKSAFLYVSPPR